MIEFISGDIIGMGEDYVIVENLGIGYNIIMPSTSIAKIINNEHLPIKSVTIYTHLYVREDIMSLYGFESEKERKIFRLLIGVNKVGPKVAIALMSYLAIDELISSILLKDTGKISKCSGIGAKTAQKIILDLSDKLKEYEPDLSNLKSDDTSNELNNDKLNEVIEALVSLGYQTNDAKRAIKKIDIDDGMSLEKILSEVLKHI